MTSGTNVFPNRDLARRRDKVRMSYTIPLDSLHSKFSRTSELTDETENIFIMQKDGIFQLKLIINRTIKVR